MTNRPIRRLWLIEAVVFIVINLLSVSKPWKLEFILTLPFVWLSQGLRALSLSGSFGNVVAWLLLLVLTFLPMVFIVKDKSSNFLSKFWLVMLGVLLFVTLYVSINPSVIDRLVHPALVGTGVREPYIFILAMMVYGSIFAYWISLVVFKAQKADFSQLLKMLHGLLILVGIGLVLMVFGFFFSQFLIQLKESISNNYLFDGFSASFSLDTVFVVLNFGILALVYLIGLFIIDQACGLITNMQEDRYSQTVVDHVGLLVISSRKALILMVSVPLIWNLILLIFARFLTSVQTRFSLSLYPVLLVLGILFVSRLLLENKELKEEVEDFV